MAKRHEPTGSELDNLIRLGVIPAEVVNLIGRAEVKRQLGECLRRTGRYKYAMLEFLSSVGAGPELESVD